MWTVTRQRQWPDGGTVVEISAGGLDYTNPDALAGKYPGEFEEFGDPREAVEAAIGIAEAWKADAPDDDIQIATGGTGGWTMPFDGEELTEGTKQGLRDWAEGVWGKFPDCECGDKITGDPVTLLEYEDEKFCSENCAERWYEKQQEEQRVWDEEQREPGEGADDEETDDELGEEPTPSSFDLKSSSRRTSMRYKCRVCGRETSKPGSSTGRGGRPGGIPTCDDPFCGATRDPVKEDTEDARWKALIDEHFVVEDTDATRHPPARSTDIDRSMGEGTPRASGAYHRIARALEAALTAAPDAKVENLGSVHILQPLSAAGAAWARENLAVEPWQMIGGGIAIEPRMIQNIIDGMEGEGLTVDAGTREAARRGKQPDVNVENLGSVCILQPLSAAGKAWTDKNLAVEPWQMIGGGISIEPRMVQDIVDGMEGDGLTVGFKSGGA